MDDRSQGTSVNSREVHDFWPRLLVSPILGALVVNLSGLLDQARHSPSGLIASYLWFATVAFLIWEGNRRLYFRLPRREDWLLRPWRRLRVLLALICLFTIPFAAATLWGWRVVTGDTGRFVFPGARPGEEKYAIGKIDHYFTSNTTLSAGLLILDQVVVSFVDNPIFQQPLVLDAQMSVRAAGDLNKILGLTESLRKLARQDKKE